MDQEKLNIERASKAIRDSRFVEGLSFLESNLSKDPNHKDSLYLAAVCSRYLKNYKDSKEYLNNLLIQAPDMGRAYQELGHLCKAIGENEEAASHYRQACELNPALVASWKSLFNYFNKRNNKAAAEHAHEQIKKLDSLPPILLYISQILNEGRLAIAEQKCREFLKKNPTNVYAMSLLSDIAKKFGYYDDAEILLENAVKFSPDDGEIRMKYALILRLKQKFTETMEQVNILCEKFPDNLSYQAQKASEIMQNGYHSEAIDLFEKIIKENPYNFSAMTSKGHAEKTLGKTDKAIESYKSAYKIKNDHGEAYFSLSNLKTYKFSDKELDVMKNQLKRVDLT